MSQNRSTKPKSPATPSYSLEDSLADSKTLYRRFSHASFSKAEIASALRLSSTSSSFTKRVFALTGYGLLEGSGDNFKVTQLFHKMDGEPMQSGEFKSAALQAIYRSSVFADLLNEFRTKLPDRGVIAQRLEKQKRFNAETAKVTASVLERSMQFAGVLDANNNIVPVREEVAQYQSQLTRQTDLPESRQQLNQHPTSAQSPDKNSATPIPTDDQRKTEIPLTNGRFAVVFYPPDITSPEAQKIGKVMLALVE